MLKYQTENKKILSLETFTWTWEVDKLLRSLFNKTLFSPSQEDQFRLLTLKSWTIKYRVSLEIILKLLVPIWQSKFQGRRFNNRSLGIKIPTLVGEASENILKKNLKMMYPAEENVKAWRSDKLHEYDKIKLLTTKFQDVSHFVKAYVRTVSAVRDSSRKKKVVRRPYKGSPWV